MSEDEATRTAFHEAIAAQGGSHVEDGGWMWLEGFGDVAKEYAARPRGWPGARVARPGSPGRS